MLEEQYDKFNSRLHQTYRNEVSFIEFLKLLVYLKEFKSLCLNVGCGFYIFDLNGKSFLTWHLGKEEICTVIEAQNICKNSYFDISKISNNSSLYSIKQI